MKPFDWSTVKVGDVLLYGGASPFDFIISTLTWSDADHIEICADPHSSVASRNGIGVNVYPRREKGLRYVLRPNIPFDWCNGMAWFDSQARGRPYGWTDLLRFRPALYRLLVEKWKIVPDNGGLICSQFADLFFGACAAPLFNSRYPAGVISPRDFLITPRLDLVWQLQPL